MPNTPLTPVEETRLVAMIVRGDSYEELKVAIPGRTLSDHTISNLKKRNKENIEVLQQAMAAQEAEDALHIKRKANNLLSKRLDNAEHADTVIIKAQEDYAAGEITFKDYKALVAKHRGITVSELVSVSKEMHNQTITEEAAPAAVAKDMKLLADAIQSGDEVVLNQIIFKGGGHAQS